MDDLISRQAAIDVIDAVFPVDPMKTEYAQGIACGAALAKTYVEQLPSAQPEIIRCGECKHCYIDGENVRFNVCELNHNKAQSDDWYCADAERRTDDKTNKSSSC